MTRKVVAAIGAILAFIAALGAIYYVAYNNGSKTADVEIAKYEQKVSDLNARLRSAESVVNERIIERHYTNTRTIERIAGQNRTIVERAIPERQHNLTEGMVHIYNQSLIGANIDFDLASSTTTSGISDRQSFSTIADNNAVALEVRERAEALIEWHKEQERAREEINSNR